VQFRWNDWNVDHIAEHGVTPEEAEYVVEHARSPYPKKFGGGKYGVWGQAETGWWLQVIYILSPAPVVFVIHARPLDDNEKRQPRRSQR
jgi:uncharacterized DUF497 family protein